MTKLKGAVTFIRCNKCGKQTQEFHTSAEARNWVKLNGWGKYKSQFYCPECNTRSSPKI